MYNFKKIIFFLPHLVFFIHLLVLFVIFPRRKDHQSLKTLMSTECRQQGQRPPVQFHGVRAVHHLPGK